MQVWSDLLTYDELVFRAVQKNFFIWQKPKSGKVISLKREIYQDPKKKYLLEGSIFSPWSSRKAGSLTGESQGKHW